MPLPFHDSPTGRRLTAAEGRAVAAVFRVRRARWRVALAVLVPPLTGGAPALLLSLPLSMGIEEGAGRLFTTAYLSVCYVPLLVVAWVAALRKSPGHPSAAPDLERRLCQVGGVFEARSLGDGPAPTVLDDQPVAFPSHWPRIAGPARALVFVPVAPESQRAVALPYVVRAEQPDRTYSLDDDLSAGRVAAAACRFRPRF